MTSHPTATIVLLSSLIFGSAAVGGWVLVNRDEPTRASAAGNSGGTGSGRVVPADKEKDKDDKGIFAIAGSVGELVPGVTQLMTISINNPNSWPIQVRTIDTVVGSPQVANCPANLLSVAPYRYTSGPGVTAPGKGTTTMTVPVLLADSTTTDQNGCPGATFPLTFKGTAEKVQK